MESLTHPINLHNRYDKIIVRGLATAPLTIPPPRLQFAIDYAEFAKQPGEKELIKEYKSQLPKTRQHKFVVVSKISL